VVKSRVLRGFGKRQTLQARNLLQRNFRLPEVSETSACRKFSLIAPCTCHSTSARQSAARAPIARLSPAQRMLPSSFASAAVAKCF
jgi:hypothetical protein